MKKLALYITVLSCINMQAFIDRVTILRKWNPELRQFNHVINLGDVSDLSEALNLGHVAEVKNLIDSATDQELFLSENILPAYEIRNKAFFHFAEMINEAVSLNPYKLTSPLFAVFDYAKLKGKRAINVEFRNFLMSTFIIPVLMQDFENVPRTVTCSLRDMASLILEPLEAIEEQALTLKNVTNDDYQLYLENFFRLNSRFQQDKVRAESYLEIDEDIIEHFVHKYILEKQLDYDLFKFLVFDKENDMGELFGEYLKKEIFGNLCNALINSIEHNALRAILENQNAHKIYCFINCERSESLTKMLIDLGYKLVWSYRSPNSPIPCDLFNDFVTDKYIKSFSEDD